MYQNGKSINEIAIDRKMTVYTIESHITSKFAEHPDKINDYKKRIGITDNMLQRISKAISKVGKDRLRPIKDILDMENNKKISYFQIKIGLLLL